MSDRQSKRAASQSPQSSEKRDMKRSYKQAENILSDEDHKKYDNEVNGLADQMGLRSLENSVQKANLLSWIISSCPPHASMNNFYTNFTECRKVLGSHTFVDNMLQHAFDDGSYKDLRNLGGSLYRCVSIQAHHQPPY
jgi:hypothetical protein